MTNGVPRLRVSTIALFGALGAMGLSSVAHATSTLATEDPCATGGDRTSAVLSTVSSIGGVNHYEFEVCNTSVVQQEGLRQLIRDWELPFFGGTLDGNDLSHITNVSAPEGWEFSIETVDVPNTSTGWDGVAEWQTDGDPMKDFFDSFFGGEANNPYNKVTHVLHFYTGFCEGGVAGGFFCSQGSAIFPGDSLPGFGFDSPFAETQAPYQTSWIELPRRTGDPAFPLAGPTNPLITCAATQRDCEVPEPGSLALLGLGLGALAEARRRKHGKA